MPTALRNRARRAKLRRAIRDAALRAAFDTAVGGVRTHVGHPMVVAGAVGVLAGAITYGLVARTRKG